MRRPLALVGFACLFASVVVSFIGEWSGAAALLCAAFGAVLCLFKRFRATPVAIVALFACAVQFALGAFSLQKLSSWQALENTDAVVTATVLEDAAESYGRYTAPVHVTSVCTENMDTPLRTDVTVRLSFGNRRAMAGDVLEGTVHFYLPEDTGGFSPRDNAYAKGWALYGYLYTYEDYTLTPGHTSVFAAARRELLQTLAKILPEEEAALAGGVVFGVKDGLDDGLLTDFRTAGASHLLVVSGVHLSVVAGALLGLLRRREHKLGLLSAVLISLCVVFFMGISGWTPSVVRSGVMCLLGVAAALFHAEYDSRSALGFAMLVLCALHPLAGGGIGLCLSFLSVLGILQLGPWFARWAARAAVHAGRCRSAVYAVLQGAGTSMAAVLFTLPLQALFLGGVSLLSPLVSVLLILLASVLLPCGLLAALAGCVPWLLPLAKLLVLPAGWCARWMTAIASFCGEVLAWSYIPARAWMLPAVLGILGLVMFCLFIGAKRRARIACAVMSLVIVFTGWVSWQLHTGSAVRFAVCGEESVLLFSGNTACVLQLGEEDAVPVTRALEENGVKKLRVMVLATGAEALRDAAAQVMREFPAETLLLPGGVRPDEKLLLLTEAPVIPYDNNSEIRLQYEKLTLRFCGGWEAAFPGGTAEPVPGGVRLQTTAGIMDLLLNENACVPQVPAILPEEDGAVYIDCLPDGQMQARRSDGWPK